MMAGDVIKTIAFVLLFFLPVASAAVSQDNFYTVGSDFLVLQNPQNTATDLPMIYVLYDNTNIYFDINNDGAYDYRFNAGFGGPHIFRPQWDIVQGTRIHADKPVHYVASFYLKGYSQFAIRSYFRADKISAVPPLTGYKSEYLIWGGRWNILSDGASEVYVDEGIDGTIDKTVNNSGAFVDVAGFARIYSDKPFFAYSDEGFAGVVSKDFYLNEDGLFVIAKEDGTILKIDYNNDGIPDNSSVLGKGGHYFDAEKGARVTADKPVAAFGYFKDTYRWMSDTYFSLPTSDSVANEFSVAAKNDFSEGVNKGYYLVGLFNGVSAPGQDLGVELYGDDDELLYEIGSLATGETAHVNDGGYAGHSGAPVLDRYYYYYPRAPYVRDYVGHTIAYKKIYLTAMPKSKFITPGSYATFNVRVFNPFKNVSAGDVSVKFRYNGLSMQGVANYRKASLADDTTIESSSKAVYKGSDESGYYFIFDYGGTLEAETYLDIDFVLLMPNATGRLTLAPAELTYTAETWIV